MKTFLANVLIALLLIMIFDVAAFAFLPNHYVAKLWEYRRDTPPDVSGRGKYPRGYFVEHEERGFDIGRNKTGEHWVDGITYPIWSNSLGCFDNEHSKDDKYFYFAGDSFTWGYAPFEQKFGTIIEEETGTGVFKCGVTHTGQKHQFEKLVDVVEEYGSAPRSILVFHFSNDSTNDYVHPHSTVIRGWQVDTVSIDENDDLVRHTREDLTVRVDATLQRNKKRNIRRDSQPELWLKTKRTIKYYSLTVNLLDYLRDSAGTIVREKTASDKPDLKRKLRGFSSLPRKKNDRYWYTDNPIAQNNKHALLDFKDFSARNNADLVVVLVPPKYKYNDIQWYQELREFLSDQKIRYVDLAEVFNKKDLSVTEVYWTDDAHFSPAGNRIVADILLGELQDIFQQ